MLASVDESPAVLADHNDVDSEDDHRVEGKQSNDKAYQRLSELLLPRQVKYQFIVDTEVVAHAEKKTLVYCLYAPLCK